MKDTNRVTFVGAGLNGLGLWSALSNSLKDPSGRTPPAGASWPFVKLSIDRAAIDFNMPYVHKRVRPSDVKITLGKFGYAYFRSKDGTNDFGFAVLNTDALLRELRDHGYQLDESCRKNRAIAKTMLRLLLAIGVASLLTTIALLFQG